ncbi:trehalose-phosphatase [Mycolicibacterium litorale]|uniref:Trehalose 6-phosphate phosphatase n=1 Tax=Mycolicibacterium litorale TaxID=758802 RepID=A0AAD1ITL1_9MYCO|nr:trehalose-phosphatase [Mycolicibacterium litorale]MCV7418055.1 trehalose-phosphatase [Mycolicibacterium litorale]TDY06556.1 trehalose 6-phosphatase [Mycolicibacterium litorale]BBY19297.1 trehalose 6-phosphate phosphatase [Mycolicibacterium litorale]
MADGLPTDLRRALDRAARLPRLLIACDYDGTLAPIVSNPADARPLPASAAALEELAALPATTVSLISGRALAVLRELSGVSDRVHLVGSHGSEFDTGFVSPIDERARALLVEIKGALDAIAAEFPGATVELKPASVALHVRNASPADGEAAMRRANEAAAQWDAQVTDGKAVKEFAVIHTDKGQAVDILRDQHDASAVVFLGDDVTDEKAFRRMRDGDIGVKVGPGETAAAYRVGEPQHVAEALEYLLAARRHR